MNRNVFSLLFASELFSCAIGFGVMILLVRRLGPGSFADFEYGSAVAAWWLVLVRGGFDTIVYREAARRPRLIGRFTNVLISLRLAAVLVALTAIVALAWSSGLDRGRVVVVAGLVLIPSALASDVGPRASGRFGALALAQVIRALGLALSVGVLVAGSTDAMLAAGCVVVAEIASTIVLLLAHLREHGSIRPGFPDRLGMILVRRGAVAGAIRFARVSLYAADVLVLGSLATSASLGPYAAGRRVVFALLALGLVVPSAVAPRIARAWLLGEGEARSLIHVSMERVLIVAIPATFGLMLTADRWTTWFFGERFVEGGPWLALIAARLPFVLLSNLQQVTLIACRREVWALRLVLGLVGLALAVMVPLAL